MKAKKWLLMTLGITMAVLVAMTAVMVYIDPYFHYHGPVEGRPYMLYGSGAYEKYYNDGIGKHFKYDAMITGSSVTENFMASQVENLWQCRTVKTCFAGGTLREVDEHVKRSLAANAGVSMIIRGIDEDKLLNDKDAMPSDPPEYLYDNNLFNDVNYIFNKDTWLIPLRYNLQYMRENHVSTSFDSYSSWSVKATFSKERTLSQYERPQKQEEAAYTQEIHDSIQANIDQNIVATVRDNPDVAFYYFLPPSSICQWDEWNQKGVLKIQIEAERMMIESLLAYSNVRIYGFSDRFDMITDLDNYMDKEHFSDEINDKIIDWIHQDAGRLTKDNYIQYINAISQFYTSYDYEEIFNG